MSIKFNREIIKKIILLSLPVVTGQIMFTILSFADRYFISKLGIAESSGTSISGTIIWLLATATSLVSGGTIALISRKYGEKDYEQASKFAGNSIFLASIFGLFITIVALFFSSSINNFFDATPEVTKIANSYFRILILGFPFVAIGSVIAVIFQSLQDTKTPMIIFSGMSIINIILDPILIFGIGPIKALGVEGAALATIISEILACIAIIYLLKTKARIKINFFTIPNWNHSKKILKIGIWTGLNSFSRPLSATFMQKIIAFHGTKTLAAFSFGVQWISLLFILLEGVRVAVATLVGKSIGEKNIEKAKEFVNESLKIGFLITGIISFGGIFFAEKAISFFSSDSEVIAIGSSYLVIVLLGMLFEIPMTVYAAAFNGAGNTMPPTIIAFISNWPGKLGIAYLTTYYLKTGPSGVWAAISASVIIEGILMWTWFYRGNWIKEKID